MTQILTLLRCPVCGAELSRVERSLLCPNRHTFDLAKSGYVNLLPPGKGKNAHTGDDRDMVEARVNFLKRGFYNNISDTAATVIAEHCTKEGDTLSICDMGAGEGWHSCRIAEKTGALIQKNTLLVGVDASKYAAERASKLSKSLNLMPRDGIGANHTGSVGAYFLPANIFHTPFADNTFSAAVSMFAPIAWEEAARILNEDGVLVVISSGRDHLLELRQLIYSEVHLSDEETVTSPLFKLEHRQKLRYTVTLPDKESIADLFVMTPFYYKTTEAGKARLFAKDSLTVTVDVNYTVYKKHNSEEKSV